MRLGPFATVVLATIAAPAWAYEVKARSATYLGGSPLVIERQVRTVIPLVEQVGLSVGKVELPLNGELAVHINGWASAEFGGERVLGGDVSLAWVEGRFSNRKLRARLGRQLIVGGAARTLFVDGLVLEGRLPLGFGAQAYAGIPVERFFSNTTRGDFAFGGRAFWAPSIHTEVGASFLQASQRGGLARRDVGLDGRWRPHHSLTLAASAAYSLADLRLAELDLGPRWQPFEDLEVRVVYRRTAPDLFIPRTALLSVFADTSRDEVGGAAFYQLTPRLSASVDGRAILLTGERGYEGSASGIYRPSRRPDTAMTLTVRRLRLPANAFTQARLGARHRLQLGLALSVDVDFYAFDQPIHNQKTSLSAGGTLSWAFTPSWLAAATVFAATTPTFENRVEAFAKLIYTFELTSKKDRD